MRRVLVGCAMVALAILPSMALADNQQIAEQIAKNLRNNPRLSDYRIEVTFQDGTAWLTGRVRNEEQMTTALRAALNTPGVERVVNQLAVGPQTTQAQVRMQPRASGQPDAVQPASALELNYPAVEEAPKPLRSRNASQPLPIAYRQTDGEPAPLPAGNGSMQGPAPLPMYAGAAGGVAPMRYDQPHLPNYAWPSYAAYPNYAALTYPKQYSPTAWPYIGPFYPYPQVPLGWRKVSLEWHDGWWFLNFYDRPSCRESPLGRWF